MTETVEAPQGLHPVQIAKAAVAHALAQQAEAEATLTKITEKYGVDSDKASTAKADLDAANDETTKQFAILNDAINEYGDVSWVEGKRADAGGSAMDATIVITENGA